MLGHYRALVLLWCVRFSLSSRLTLCVVFVTLCACCCIICNPLFSFFLGPMTYHLASFTMHSMPYLLPLLASSFTFLFQASICSCLLSSTELRWPLCKKETAKPGNCVSLTNHALFDINACSLIIVKIILFYFILHKINTVGFVSANKNTVGFYLLNNQNEYSNLLIIHKYIEDQMNLLVNL